MVSVGFDCVSSILTANRRERGGTGGNWEVRVGRLGLVLAGSAEECCCPDNPCPSRYTVGVNNDVQKQRLLAALDLLETGHQIKRQQLIRANPEAGPTEITELMWKWLVEDPMRTSVPPGFRLVERDFVDWSSRAS